MYIARSSALALLKREAAVGQPAHCVLGWHWPIFYPGASAEIVYSIVMSVKIHIDDFVQASALTALV